MNSFLKGMYFSITLNHWTKIANKNNAALVLHTINNFVLKKLTLFCFKDEGGSTSIEMYHQLSFEMETWSLSVTNFVEMVTDTAYKAGEASRGKNCQNSAALLC